MDSFLSGFFVVDMLTLSSMDVERSRKSVVFVSDVFSYEESIGGVFFKVFELLQVVIVIHYPYSEYIINAYFEYCKSICLHILVRAFHFRGFHSIGWKVDRLLGFPFLYL